MQQESASFLKRKIGEHRKRHRSSVSQDVKLDVLDRHMKGERSAHIAHLLGLPPTTVRTIIKNREKILETAKLVPKHVSLKLTRLRSDRMEKMECLLSLWLQDLYQQNAPVSLALIQEKAISLYKDIEIEGETGKPVPFSASRGWFHRFQKRYGFKNVRMQGEAVSIGKDLAEGFPETLKTIIEEGSYDPRQIFNADETGLYWKRLPSRTPISVHEKDVPGFPASKDRLSLLLGANASGDMKLKPLLVYHSENPLAMKNYVKSQLPVLWKSHKRAWITRQIFRDWFMDYFVPEAKKYCEEKDLAFKVLLILDSASAHDLDFESLCPNVKVVLIPPRSTSLVQPMDQGVIAKFKASYLRRTFYRLIQETDGEGKRTVQEFWEEFNIMDGVMMISAAWQEIPSHIMNGAWKNLYPEAVYHLVDFQEALVHREIAQLAKEAGFQEVEEDDIKEWLISHSLPLSKEELVELHKQHPRDDRVGENEEKGRDKDAGLTIPVLQRVFDLYKEIVDILTKSDALGVRSARAIAVMADGLSCYRKILDAKMKHSSQATTDIFLIKGIRKDPKLFMDEPQLGTSDIKRQKTIHALTAEGPPGAAVSPAVFDSNSTGVDESLLVKL